MIFPPPPRASRGSLETAIAVAVAAIASVNLRKIFISNVLPPMKRPFALACKLPRRPKHGMTGTWYLPSRVIPNRGYLDETRSDPRRTDLVLACKLEGAD